MSERLDLLYELIPKNGIGVIDVGTDHAKIPVRLAISLYPGNIFASDIARGPLEAALFSARAVNVEDRIHFLLCDGLQLCPHDQISCILIAGMGGDTICRILDREEWIFSDDYTLVLQPMTKPEVVRYWLVHNEFCIEQEAAVQEDQHYYQMFTARMGKSGKMKDAEYLLGSFTAPRRGVSISRLIDHQLLALEKKLTGLRTSEHMNVPEYCFYQNVKLELEEYEKILGE